jgi:predicted nucleic acid-binding Zn ribbon protein
MTEDYFDFQEIVEEEDKLDFDKLVMCPHCKKPIPQQAVMCFYCGEEVLTKSTSDRWKMLLTAVIVIVFVIVALIL